MAATEQLNIRVKPGEKERVARDARREGSSNVSDYVRQRLFGHQPSDADQALLGMLAEIKPMVTRAIRTIDVNLAEIQKLRDGIGSCDDVAVAERARNELNAVELAAVAERLQLQPLPARRVRKAHSK
ncbi:plasmid mobilization protein [Xanthomonas albilineans]|uniref:plasmid mobilization protein n=1 Tax=Xanthomonas albilineans TaxID=29447 RepID=UPI0005F32C67|nr:hypothetical protein [Xanthomonas albilineans]